MKINGLKVRYWLEDKIDSRLLWWLSAAALVVIAIVIGVS